MAKSSPKALKTLGNGEIALYKQFLFFPGFSKYLYCIHIKKQMLVVEKVEIGNFMVKE